MIQLQCCNCRCGQTCMQLRKSDKGDMEKTSHCAEDMSKQKNTNKASVATKCKALARPLLSDTWGGGGVNLALPDSG